MLKNVYAKDAKNDKVFPFTTAKNVFDSNGINLEEHLNLIYSHINNRDIKRVYLELEHITDKENPSTYDILSAMENNTIAMLSVEAKTRIVTEIGARWAGVLILIKKTSIYFSAGTFFTYRYGETFTGVSGLGGNSFEWHKNVNPIHSLHSGTATQLQTANTYEKITNWGGTAVNPRLSINSNGTITIPEGVKLIKISAYVVIESVTDGVKFLQIFKNDIATNLMVKQKGSENITLSITPLLLEVTEGDTIDLRVYSNSLDRLRFKHMTIEVID